MTKGKIYKNEWNSTNTLFAYWIGTQDIVDIDRKKYKHKLNETIDSIVDTFFKTIDDIYKNGARNFLFFNVPALDELPNFNRTNRNEIKKDCTRFNHRLNKKSVEFFGYHNDTNVILYNIKDELRYIMKNYKEFNFINNNETYEDLRSKDPDIETDDLIWLHDFHSTSKTNEILARNIDLLLTNYGVQSFCIKFLSIFINIAFIILLLI